MNKTIEYLNSQKSATPSKWRENALWRRDNKKWLGYSRAITLKILRAMDEQSITQSILADRIGCSQQYVSNLLKGNSNMTLETISKVEDALSIDLIQSILDGVSRYSTDSNQRARYLCDSTK